VTGTAEFQVVRADGTIDRIPASTEATVNTGDALVTLNQIGLTTVNSGDTDAEILEWTLLDSPGDKFAGRSGQAGLFGITHVVASDGRRNMIDLPGGAIVRLQRMDLAPGEPIYRVDGVVQLAVTFDPVTEPIIYAGDGSYIKASNSNGTPTTSVYLLTLMPADDSSPPGANTPKA
jgi:hypothetical protein